MYNIFLFLFYLRKAATIASLLEPAKKPRSAVMIGVRTSTGLPKNTNPIKPTIDTPNNTKIPNFVLSIYFFYLLKLFSPRKFIKQIGADSNTISIV